MARRLLYPYPQNPTACSTNCSPACDFYLLCSRPPLLALPPPPPLSPAAAAATIHLSHSPRLPLPLLLLASTLLAISLLLLLSLLLAFLRRRLRRRHSPTAAIAEGGADFDIYDAAAGGDGDDVVHHVWYIRTVGLDDRAIAAIAACVYRGGNGGAGGGGGCAVCLGEFSDGEVLRLLPKCGHAFHRQCVDTWLRAHVSCPLCRSPVIVPAAGGCIELDSGNGVLGEQVAELSLRPPPPPTSSLSSVHLGAIDASSARYGERQRWRIVRRSASMGSLPFSAPLPKDWGERKFDEGSGSMDGDSPHSAKISPELEPKPEPEPAEATGTEGHGSRRFLRADMAAKDPGESDRMRG